MEASFKGEGSVARGDDRSLIQVSSFNQLFAAFSRRRGTLRLITLNIWEAYPIVHTNVSMEDRLIRPLR